MYIYSMYGQSIEIVFLLWPWPLNRLKIKVTWSNDIHKVKSIDTNWSSQQKTESLEIITEKQKKLTKEVSTRFHQYLAKLKQKTIYDKLYYLRFIFWSEYFFLILIIKLHFEILCLHEHFIINLIGVNWTTSSLNFFTVLIRVEFSRFSTINANVFRFF